MRVTVISPTCQEFNGTRYYLCGPYFQRKGKRLHRAVWEALNGPIPTGMHVHHVDHDRANNQPENLALVSKTEHLSHHASTPEAKAAARKRMIEVISPKAKAWHSSPEGRAWHSENARQAAAKAPIRSVVCAVCGETFETRARRKTLYCSGKCCDWAKARRDGIPLASELPRHTLVCPICGVSFSTPVRNTRAKVCPSLRCKNKYQSLRRKSLK